MDQRESEQNIISDRREVQTGCEDTKELDDTVDRKGKENFAEAEVQGNVEPTNDTNMTNSVKVPVQKMEQKEEKVRLSFRTKSVIKIEICFKLLLRTPMYI